MTDGICPFAQQIVGVTSFSRGNYDRVGFCDHTAGGYYTTMQNPAFWNGAGVSTHFAISQKGDICQMVNIFDTAFAQGRLGPVVTWPPYAEMNYTNPNGYLISTEHEDKTVTNYQWSPEMYAADLKLKKWCIEEVARVSGKDLMRFGIDSLSGHYMFDGVNRPYCPGTGWPREQLYNDLKEGNVDQKDLEELADLRALQLLMRDIDWPKDGIYRPVAVAEENGMLLIQLWKKDRTQPVDPPSFWVRKA